MADRSQWKSMSGSSRFGIYRETPSKHRKTGAGRFCCSLAIFLVITTVICLTALSITTGKGRKRMKVVVDRGRENGELIVNATGKTTVEEFTTPTPTYDATEVGRHDEPSEPSIPRPEVDNPSKLEYPEDDDPEGQNSFIDEERKSSQEFAHRKGRIMNDPAVSPYKMRLPPRFANPPASASDQRPNVVFFSTSQSGDFSGNFAQMAPYNRHRDSMKNSQEILDYAADDRPIPIFPKAPAIKFTGVYVRGPAEEIENISLDNKKQLNGHAYSATTDPFKAYKPAHPAEINHLATTASELDTGIRFSNKINRPTTTATTLMGNDGYDVDMGASGSATLTQAIFHPYGSSVTSSSGPLTPRDKKSRPLKIMLDIYPVHQPDLLEQGTAPVMDGRRKQPLRPIPPVRQIPPVAPPPPVPPPTQPSRMIVHLNLFPKRSPKNSNQRRGTTQPTGMTLVPGGGSHFQDRMFDSVERPVATHQSFPDGKTTSNQNDSVPDESIEIAERYPVPPEILADRNSRAAFVLNGDQVMEHSAPYNFVIGRAHSRNDRDRHDDQDDGGGEGGVYILEDLEELQGVSHAHGLSEEDKDVSHESEGNHEDIEASQGERAAFHEEEGTGNGYKVVSFQVSGDMDGVVEDAVEEGGIIRAEKPSDIVGRSKYGATQDENPVGESETTPDGPGSANPPKHYRPDEVYGLISGRRPQPNRGSQSDRTLETDSLHDKGIRIKKINPPRFFPQPTQTELHDVTYDDDKLPIGTVSEMGPPELDRVPGYNEGSIIEPRVDVGKPAWWPTSAMLQSNTSVSSTTGLPIVFPTSPTPPNQESTEGILLVEQSTPINPHPSMY